MNDEFLYQLREQPSKSFAAKLKAKLEIQASAAIARQRKTKWYVLGVLLLGGTAVAITPFVRDALAPTSRSSAGVEASSIPKTIEPTTRQAADATSAQAAVADTRALPYSKTTVVSPAGPTGPTVPSPRVDLYVAAPADVVRDLTESFRDTYGYDVRSQSRSTEPMCSRWIRWDVVVTLGRMRDDDKTACEQAGARYIEVELAYEAYVAVIHRENTWVDSLTVEDLRMLGDRPSFAPMTTWNQVRAAWPSLPIAIYGLASTERTTGDKFMPNRNARSLSIDISGEDARVAASIEATYGGLGFMTFATYETQLAEAEKAGKAFPVKVLPIVNAANEAVAPSRKAIQEGRYDTLAQPLMLYANAGSIYRTHVNLFATHAIESFSQDLDQYGYTKIDKAVMDVGARRIRAQQRR